MLVGELISRTNNGESLKEIAQRELNISVDTLRRKVIKPLGYEWDNSSKLWHFDKEGEPEPLELDVIELLQTGSKVHPISSDVKPSVKSVHLISSDVNQNVSHYFTLDEIDSLKRMLASWKQSVPTVEVDRNLIDRINELKVNPKRKVRKTIVISDDAAKMLDEFAERERLNKSDLLHVAILDLINKYAHR